MILEPVYWKAICAECGWTGMSNFCGGGHAMADTGDYEDITCPECGSTQLDEA